MDIPPLLRAALADAATMMAPARHDWWIIASAALVLHGVDPGPVRDVDVLFDPRDAERVLAPLGLEPRRGSDDGRFRSDLFATWTGAALPIELFAGFALFENGGWTPVVPQTRQLADCDGHRLWVPSPAELHALLLRFGRDKDLARASLLSPSGRSPSRSGNA